MSKEKPKEEKEKYEKTYEKRKKKEEGKRKRQRREKVTKSLKVREETRIDKKRIKTRKLKRDTVGHIEENIPNFKLPSRLGVRKQKLEKRKLQEKGKKGKRRLEKIVDFQGIFEECKAGKSPKRIAKLEEEPEITEGTIKEAIPLMETRSIEVEEEGTYSHQAEISAEEEKKEILEKYKKPTKRRSLFGTVSLAQSKPYVFFLEKGNLRSLWEWLVKQELVSREKSPSKRTISINRLKDIVKRDTGLHELRVLFEEHNIIELVDVGKDFLSELEDKKSPEYQILEEFIRQGNLKAMFIPFIPTSGKKFRFPGEIEKQTYTVTTELREQTLEDLFSLFAATKDLPSVSVPSFDRVTTLEEVWEKVNEAEDRVSPLKYQQLATKYISELNKKMGEFERGEESPQHVAMKAFLYHKLINDLPQLMLKEGETAVDVRDEEGYLKIEYETDDQIKIGDLYDVENKIWIEVETGRIPESEGEPLQYIFKKLKKIADVRETINQLWIVFPLYKLSTWGIRDFRNLKTTLHNLLQPKGLEIEDIRLKFIDFHDRQLIDLGV